MHALTRTERGPTETAKRHARAGPASPEPVPREHLRLITKAARMYHERGMRQPEIAAQLHISQPRVSRLLKQATKLGIVRTTVTAPSGVHSELEGALEARYGLHDAVVVDTEETEGDHDALLSALGAAAAIYLETTLTGEEHIGVSSWSASLLATVDQMRPRPSPVAREVMQVIGGVGTATAQPHATRLVGRLAQLTGAEAVFLPVPGLVASAAVRDGLMDEPSVKSVVDAYGRLTMVLAGIGSLEPSQLLRQSGNAIRDQDREELQRHGAVGDICLHFFDEHGAIVPTSLEGRLVGLSLERLRAVPRIVAVAGGRSKQIAIRAALRGRWLTVLITDLGVATRLLQEEVQR